MKAEEYRKLADDDLQDRLAGLREELFNLKFQATTEPIDDPGKIRQKKKDIARIRTILRARQKGVEVRPQV